MERDAALEAVFQPVRSPTTFEETVERLGIAIRVGVLDPGTRLPPERDLAAQLDISRSTLRQALRTLIQSGHLVSSRGRRGGTFVAEEPPLTVSADVEALWSRGRAVLDERVAIEVGATLLAAERSEPADLDRLQALVERMRDAVAFESYRRADVRFHIGIAEAAHSPALVASMTEIQGRLGELIAAIPHPDEVLARSNEQHGKLLALLRKRDAARSVTMMRLHLEGTEHILAGFLR